MLCPGYVRTRIGESGRNRPERYGAGAGAGSGKPGGRDGRPDRRTRCSPGSIRAEVAARVLAAIRDNELYVFTHPDMRGEVDERFAAIQAAMDKVVDRADRIKVAKAIIRRHGGV